MPQYELGIVGAGNMAEAIVRGIAAGRVLPIEAVVCSDPLKSRREHLSRTVGVACVEDNTLPASCPRVLLAVKPQVMGTVLEGIASAVGKDALVISIAAGIKTSFIDEKLAGAGRIVRVMPNTPMLVGAGISAIAPGPRADKQDVDWTETLFAACGKTVGVGEEMMDAVTAVSGSGPAYFFYLIEAMIQAGLAEGLTEQVAAELAIETCRGAAQLLARTHETPQTLRARVTSPGGTTQRAIETLETAGVKQILIQAVRAAAARSRELAG